MKKNLLYLWALICSVALFTACSSDDDNDISGNNPPEEEAVVTAPDVVGTYWGNLDISMKPDNSDQETVIGNGDSQVYHHFPGQRYGSKNGTERI